MKSKIASIFLCLLIIICLLSSCNRESKELKCIDVKLTSEEYAYAVSKENTELLNAVNELLLEIKSNGTLDGIISKYFSNDTSKIKTYDKGEELHCKEQLVVATHIPFSPFEYQIGERYCGIDIEIASLIAEKLNLELVIKEYDFNDIISAVENNEVDIAMAALSVSSDRESHIQFSNTYFKASQIIVAKADDTTFDSCQSTEDVVNILLKMNKGTKIGYQKGTVSESYIVGNQKLKFTGFNTDKIGFDSALDAIKALKNGDINYVIVDEGPGKIIVDQLNKQN
jgi:polar amino acid transport system substrate-binding protein